MEVNNGKSLKRNLFKYILGFVIIFICVFCVNKINQNKQGMQYYERMFTEDIVLGLYVTKGSDYRVDYRDDSNNIRTMLLNREQFYELKESICGNKDINIFSPY